MVSIKLDENGCFNWKQDFYTPWLRAQPFFWRCWYRFRDLVGSNMFVVNLNQKDTEIFLKSEEKKREQKTN